MAHGLYVNKHDLKSCIEKKKQNTNPHAKHKKDFLPKLYLA